MKKLQYDITTIDDFKIKSINHGMRVLLSLQTQIHDKTLEMHSAKTNEEWELIAEEHYQMIKLKRSIQNQMQKIASRSIKVGAK